MNKLIRHIFLWGVILCGLPLSVIADEEKAPVAGEVISQSKNTPYVQFDPHPTITGLFTPRPVDKQSEDVYFSADEMQNDSNTNIVTALGDVYIIRSDMTLRADKVTYNQDLDVVTASGNVSLVDQSNNILYADEMVLHDKMSRGSLEKLKVLMRDESHIWANKFKTKKNNDKVMYNATYTPCDCCLDKEPRQEPLWKIYAHKIKHDVEKQNVYYNHALLKIKDVPVFYTPFLAHPDPTVKRRSGFLMPMYGSSGFLDTYINPGYFWAISDHSDLTFKPYISTKRGFVPFASYRTYFQKGEMDLSGSWIPNDKDYKSITVNKQNKGTVTKGKKNRGHFFAKGRYEINENWLAKLDAYYVSDTLYLRDLSLPQRTEPWLTSNLNLQYFNNRDYASIDTYYFRMISYDLKTMQRRNKYNGAYVLPLLDYEKYSKLSKNGLYARNQFNFASLSYNDEDSSVQRGTMINEVVLPYTSRFGEKMRLVGSLKSDFYYVDNYLRSKNNTYTGDAVRVFPQLGAEWKLPFIKANEESRQIIEPIIVAVLAPNDNNKENRIPNEDSQDTYLDDVNILDLDRYSGFDRNDTGSRVSYGFNWSSYGNVLGRTQAFIAQSYYFDDHQSFSESVGDKGYFSDYVGHIYANPSEFLDLNYRYRLDKDDFDLKYSELGASFGPQMLKAYVSYIYLKDENTNQNNAERHELYTSLTAKLSRDWSLRIFNRQDLSSGHGYSLEHGGSITYEDECLALTGNIQRYNSNDPNVENNYEFSVSFLLKTIGGLGKK